MAALACTTNDADPQASAATEEGTGDTASGDTSGADTTGGAVAEADAPEALARAECMPRFDCGCSDPGYADVDACIDARTSVYAAAATAANDAGLSYDAECVAGLVAFLDGRGCTLRSALTFLDSVGPNCRPYSDPANASGGACNPVGDAPIAFATQCAASELCADGTCVSPWWLQGNEIGGACDGLPESCIWPAVCVASQCQGRVPVGSSCGGADPTAVCDERARCDGDECVPLLGPGEPCSEEGTDLTCINAECVGGVCFDEPAVCADL